MTALAATVHWTESGLMAKVENDGNGDTCGPIVVLDYMNRIDAGKFPLNNTQLVAMRSEYIAKGWMNNPAWGRGMVITSIASAFGSYGVKPVKVVPWNDNLDFNQFHTDLHDAMLKGQAVIWETHNAQALPNNQQNVFNHFVLSWGIDSVLGYYCCNGDTYAALGSGQQAVSPIWYGINDIQAALIRGYLILPAIQPISGGTTMWTVDKTATPQPNAVDQHGTHLTYGMADFVIANPATANAVQGMQAIWYPYDGANAYTVLEDNSVLHYSSVDNKTLLVAGREGTALAGSLKSLWSARQQISQDGLQLKQLTSQLQDDTQMIAKLQAELASGGNANDAAAIQALAKALGVTLPSGS